ncbi:MAG: sensory histidine kinase AtoS [Methanomassiliicoccales archaeon PtaU1.Bin124]|nr:MAG: sensory histidine kinase AtoS [Methanomassiliicoccales archaeon PtaU1.Bin124]
MERSHIGENAIKVLYVDDEPDLNDLAKAYLQSHYGVAVITADSAQAALSLLGDDRFDAVVSDYQMPGMDGLELLVKLRKEMNDIPFILFTGRGREEVVIEALNNGADYYIQKGGEPRAAFAELHHKIKLAVERRRAAVKLRESESRFRGIIENAHAGYFLMSLDGKLLDVNHSWLSMHGMESKNDALGKDLIGFLAAEDKERGSEILEMLLHGECSNPTDLHFRRKDGGTGIYTLTASPVIEGLGFLGVEGFCFDVTEVRSIAEELGSSRKRHDELFRTMDEGVAMHELVYKDGKAVDYIILDVNPAFERILGIRREDAVGRLATEVYGVPKAPFLSQYESVAENGIPLKMEVHFEPMNTFFDISVTSSERGKFSTLFFDTTKSKVMTEEIRAQSDEIQTQNEQLQAQREELMETYDKVVRSNHQLKDSEEKWKSVIDATSDGVVEYDLCTDRIIVNPRIRSLLGYSVGDITLRMEQMVALIHPEDRPKMEQRLKRYLHGEAELFHSEHRVQGQDGRYYWTMVRMKVIERDEGGKASKMLGTVQDINASKIAEEALRTANRKLNLLNTITRHDLRNQLMILQGNVTILREMLKGEEQLNCLKRMDKTLSNIEHHIEFTKLYDNLGSERPRWHDLSQLSRRVLRSAKTEGVSLQIDIDGLEVYADPMLEKVLHNLADNSIRHGGNVSRIKLHWYQEGKDAVIVYEDNGRGIPAEYREHLFEKGKGHNTGLGLFLSREILSITGIGIDEAGDEKGARFRMKIPEGSFRLKAASNG